MSSSRLARCLVAAAVVVLAGTGCATSDGGTTQPSYDAPRYPGLDPSTSDGGANPGPGRDGPAVGSDSGPGSDGPGPDPDSGPIECPDGKLFCDGRCIDTRINVQHCGGCNNACHDNARCNEGVCDCYEPYKNCDGDWTNGCECDTECDGTGCKVFSCDPAVSGDCGTDTFYYCTSTDRVCKPCQVGWENCDLKGTCECKLTAGWCESGKCVY